MTINSNDPRMPAKFTTAVLRDLIEANAAAAPDFALDDGLAGFVTPAAADPEGAAALPASLSAPLPALAAPADPPLSGDWSVVAALTASRIPLDQSIAEPKATLVNTSRIEAMKNSVSRLLSLCRN